MTPDQHVTISVGSGVILGMLLRSWVAGLSCSLIGIFIDLDHYLDFWLNRGFSLSVRRLMDFCYHGTTRKFFAVFHGYEFIPLLAWIATLPGCRNLGVGLAAGYTVHILGDQFFNTHLSPWTYFLTYRLAVRFESTRIVRNRPFSRNARH